MNDSEPLYGVLKVQSATALTSTKSSIFDVSFFFQNSC